MKTFAVNSTVIFVTEVIFLGIYCTFFCHETHSKSAPLNAFFKNKNKQTKKNKKRTVERSRLIIAISSRIGLFGKKKNPTTTKKRKTKPNAI